MHKFICVIVNRFHFNTSFLTDVHFATDNGRNQIWYQIAAISIKIEALSRGENTLRDRECMLPYNNVVYLAENETKREVRERVRKRHFSYFRVTADFTCQTQREKERESDRMESVRSKYASNGFMVGSIFCPMWNVARRRVTFRSTFLVPDIRCQLHFGTTLCQAIHHNARPYSWTVSLSDEHAYVCTYCRYDPLSSLFTHDDTRPKLLSFSLPWYKIDTVYQYSLFLLPGKISNDVTDHEARTNWDGAFLL